MVCRATSEDLQPALTQRLRSVVRTHEDRPMSQTALATRYSPSAGSFAAMLLLALMWGVSIPIT